MMGSILTIITPATGRALVDAQTVQEELGTVEDTAYLQQLILAASEVIEGHCQRSFGQETVREIITPPWCAKTVLLRSPASSIVSLTSDGTALTAGADYILDESGRVLYRRGNGAAAMWSSGEIVVEYVRGYVLPSQDSPTLPAAVSRACVVLVTSWYQSRGRDLSVRSESAQDVGQTSWLDPRDGMEALLPQVAGMLEPYCAGPLIA